MMKHWKIAAIVAACLVAGLLGSSAWWHATDMSRDWDFLHNARMQDAHMKDLIELQRLQQAEAQRQQQQHSPQAQK